MVHYVSTSTLVYQVRTTRPQGIIEPFGQLLRKAGSMGDIRVCPVHFPFPFSNQI